MSINRPAYAVLGQMLDGRERVILQTIRSSLGHSQDAWKVYVANCERHQIVPPTLIEFIPVGLHRPMTPESETEACADELVTTINDPEVPMQWRYEDAFSEGFERGWKAKAATL